MQFPHIYTYGEDSIQFLILTKDQKNIINEFTARFIEAQIHFKQEHGRPWTIQDPIEFRDKWTIAKNDQYNALVPFLNRQHKVRNWIFKLLRVDVSKEPLEDYLVLRR